MGRVHLFEFADLGWFPRTLADAGTAYLHVLQEKLDVAKHLAPLVAQAIPQQMDKVHLLDLCSGGGGPAPAIRQVLAQDGREVWLTLSDLKPNEVYVSESIKASPQVVLHPEPVDATDVPSHLNGVRTVFNAMHHMPRDIAQSMLRDAQDANTPIVVAELSERTIANVLSAPIIALMVLLIMPIVRPMRPLWLVLTYLVPILPLTIAWDGWVSHLRTYNLKELRSLTDPLKRDGWQWQVGQTPVGPAKITWLIGKPI